MKQALRDALDERGYENLTPVQEAVTVPELIGRDLLVSAQTGSGKTLGFGLAIAPNLLGENEVFQGAGAPLALVIAPTRELALQVKRELGWLYAKAGVRMASCVGGMDMRDERRALDRGAHIVVATPGRLRDHIMRGAIDLTELRAVVLDEADEMLDLGFREDLEFILGETPETRQTLLFSATVPKMIVSLAQNYQKDAHRVITKSEKSQHADIEYKAMQVAEQDGENAVINILRFYESPNAIVFANTRAMVNRLTTRLSNRGFQVVALSGELSQTERSHALQAMRDGRANVCVATDVAARGIDLPNLDLVIHAELPSSHETLLHRSGRTGRAGRKGVSALIVTRRNTKKASRILGMAKLKADWCEPPSAEAIKARDDERMLADEAWQLPVDDSEKDAVAGLVDAFSAEQIAAAYLRLFRGLRTAPEELADANAKPQPRRDFGPSTWFSIAGGRAADQEPRRLLPMLITAGNLNKDDIGAIRIQGRESYVQLRAESVAGFLKALGSDMKVEGNEMRQLAEAPDLGPSGPRGKGPGDKPRFGKPGGGRPSDRGRDRDGGKPSYRDDKPRRDDNRRDDTRRDEKKPYKSKDNWEDRPPRDDAPAKPKPRPAKPVEWNDDGPERRKKPKPTAKPARAQHKAAHVSGARRGGDDAAAKPDAGASKKPRHKNGAPPTGKPNSKKNKARRAMADPSQRIGGGRGGDARPRRK